MRKEGILKFVNSPQKLKTFLKVKLFDTIDLTFYVIRERFLTSFNIHNITTILIWLFKCHSFVFHRLFVLVYPIFSILPVLCCLYCFHNDQKTFDGENEEEEEEEEEEEVEVEEEEDRPDEDIPPPRFKTFISFR